MGGWGVGGIRVYYYYIYITERNNEMELNKHTQSTHLQDIFAMARVGRTTLFEIHTVEPGKKRKKVHYKLNTLAQYSRRLKHTHFTMHLSLCVSLCMFYRLIHWHCPWGWVTKM